MRFGAASAVEANLGTLFVNAKDEKIIHFIVQEMGQVVIIPEPLELQMTLSRNSAQVPLKCNIFRL